jgi:hypothetical protein
MKENFVTGEGQTRPRKFYYFCSPHSSSNLSQSIEYIEDKFNVVLTTAKTLLRIIIEKNGAWCEVRQCKHMTITSVQLV